MDINTIKQKFQSGNGIEVPEARVTKEEFDFLISKLRNNVTEDDEVERIRGLGPAYPYTTNTAPPTPLAIAPVPVLKDWRIDTSAGGPILVYKDCSVIESAQAEYVLRLIAADQASADPAQEVAGVTLDGCLETLFRVGEYLGIDYAESRKQPGAPSNVYIKAIEDRISQALAASSAVCQGRSDSLFDGGMLTAANEAHKCAEAIKWRAKELLDKIL